jgi:two-component system cell cycle response regulator
VLRLEVEPQASNLPAFPTEGRADPSSPVVLVADDDDEIRELVALVLRARGYQVIEARDGDQALRAAVETQPDLLLLDIGMPGADGLRVCAEIQKRGADAPPVVFVTANAETDARIRGLDLGATDYIVKPFSPAELAARVRAALRTKARQDALAADAATDPLTGLANRRQLDARVAEAFALALRGRPMACVMVDLDGFKAINDAYGHSAGDRVLVTAAQRLRAALRVTDVIGRYGGDEFLLVLEAPHAVAGAIAAKLLRALTAGPVAIGPRADDGPFAIEIGASVGVACWDPSMAEPGAVVAAADGAMYRAKQLGGASVVVAGS